MGRKAESERDIRPLRSEDRPLALALLRQADLPVSDLVETGGARFLALEDEDGLVACGALEAHGQVGLVRSIAVTPGRRGEGIGRRIVAALEREARAADIEHLYLLTTTAAAFFAALGYEEAPRDAAPPAIRATPQFADLCPASATFMRKPLPPPP